MKNKEPDLPPFEWYRYPDDIEVLEPGCEYLVCIDVQEHGEKLMFAEWRGYEMRWGFRGLEGYELDYHVQILGITHFMHVRKPDVFDS